MNQLIKGAAIVQLITVAAGASASTVLASVGVIDFANYEGALIVVGIGPVTSGAVTSLKLQDGTTTNPTTDVAGSNITVADTDDNTVKVYDWRRPVNRYGRLYVTRGTQAATVVAYAILYGARNRPVVQSTTDVTGSVVLVSPAQGTP